MSEAWLTSFTSGPRRAAEAGHAQGSEFRRRRMSSERQARAGAMVQGLAKGSDGCGGLEPRALIAPFPIFAACRSIASLWYVGVGQE